MADDKLRVEMLERELHGVDIELGNAYKEHVALLKRIEGLQVLRREICTRIDRIS